MHKGRDQVIETMVRESYPLLTKELEDDLPTIKKRSKGETDYTRNLWNAHSEALEAILDFVDVHPPIAEQQDIVCETLTGLKISRKSMSLIYGFFKEARQFRALLTEADDKTVMAMYRAHVLVREPAREQELSKADRWAFFDMPDADARWDYWRLLPAWSVQEATALSMGKDPDVVNAESLKSEAPAGSLFASRFRARSQIFERAVALGQLDPLMTPASFVTWCAERDMPIPEGFTSDRNERTELELSQALEIQSLKKRLLEYETDLDKINAKSKRSMQLMLLVMAIRGYTHKLDGNSPAPSDIVSDFKLLGLKINRDTVLDTLRDAASDLSEEGFVGRIRKSLSEIARSRGS